MVDFTFLPLPVLGRVSTPCSALGCILIGSLFVTVPFILHFISLLSFTLPGTPLATPTYNQTNQDEAYTLSTKNLQLDVQQSRILGGKSTTTNYIRAQCNFKNHFVR